MKVEIETEDRYGCTPCEYKDTKNKNVKIHTLRRKKKSIRRKKKIRSSGVISVNIKVLKRINGTHTKETDIYLKTQEMWLIQACMYQNGYYESALKYKAQRAGGNNVGMPLMC